MNVRSSYAVSGLKLTAKCRPENGAAFIGCMTKFDLIYSISRKKACQKKRDRTAGPVDAV